MMMAPMAVVMEKAGKSCLILDIFFKQIQPNYLKNYTEYNKERGVKYVPKDSVLSNRKDRVLSTELR